MKRFYYSFCLLLLIFCCVVNINEAAASIGNDKTNRKVIKRLATISPIYKNKSFAKILIPRVEIKPVYKNAFAFERNFDDDEHIPNFDSSEEIDPLNWGKYRSSENLNPDSVIYFAEEAIALLQSVKENGRLIDQLTAEMTFQLPVGIEKTIGGLKYTVVFHKLKLTEANAYVDAYLIIETSKDTLTFMGRGIEFSAEGGITGEGRLELIGDANIPLPGNKAIITLLGSDNPTKLSPTYAEFDCYGFKELAIDADVKFSKDLFIKENPDGTRSDERLTTKFTTTVTDWNNILVDLTLPRFQLKSLEGWSFEVSNAVFDFSDVRNSSDIKFPEGYDSPYFIEGTRELWRGFYLRELVVTLPEEFNKKNGTGRTSFRAAEMIIDESGFTGKISAREILSLNEGDADKWAISVKEISAEFLQNDFVGAEFNGELLMPTLKTDEPLAYRGLIQTGGNYQIVAELQDSLDFDLWKADVQLLENSRIELAVRDGKFKPKAVLHGSMNISPTFSNGNKGASLANIDFESLTIQTDAPYMQAEYFGFGSEELEQKMAKFPIQISEVAFQTENEKVGLSFKFYVNLVKSSDNGFGGGAGLTIWANLTENEGIQKYQYDRLQINEITIDVSKDPGFSFNGTLTFYENDPAYGRGFRGNVNAKLGGIDVSATAIFGNVNAFRYWYVDAMVVTQTGIPVVPPFSVNGFGGGAYYHMRQQGLNENVGSEIGRSSSGIVYVPDKDSYLGIKASVSFSLQGSQESLNGDATFEVNFNKHGGVNQIAFLGNAKFMTTKFAPQLEKVKEVASKMNEAGGDFEVPDDNSSSVRGRVELLFNNQDDTFYGNIKVFVNVGGVVKGIGSNDLAGEAVIYFAPDEWFIHVGKPTSPVGLEFLGIARTESYFMIGHNLPSSPPPPNLVTEILGSQDLDYNRNLNKLKSGKGIAFGSRLIVDTGDQNFLIFYGRFAATAGFDLMMKDYGTASCEGRSGPIGVDGWYANGQAYVGMLATIGIKVRLTFIKKDIEIFHGAAAAIMQAQGPNPFWMKGTVGGEYRVLNGLVSGSFDFEVTVGDKCEIQQEGSPLDNIDIIAELTPQEGTKEVDVFTTPQAIFNIPVNEEFELVDVDNVKHFYKVELEHFRIKDQSTILPANLIFNSNNDVIGLQTNDVFPSEKELLLEVEIRFKEKLNGSWQLVRKDGAAVKESKSIRFTSGLEPDYIPKSNVAYAYPMEGMVNFYQDQTNAGYVKLKQGMSRPFENDGSWNFKVAFTDESNNSKRSSYSYNSSTKQVNFTIPDNIGNNKILKFDLLRVPKSASGDVDRNVDSVRTGQAIEGGNENVSLEIRTNSAKGTIETLSEKSILAYYIRSSKYNTIRAKFTDTNLNINTGWRYPLRAGIHELGYTLSNLSEEFGSIEINGMGNTDPLISFEADFTNNNWYSSYLNPIVYQGYPLNSNLNIDLKGKRGNYGVPPREAIYIRQLKENFLINQDNGFQQSIGFNSLLAIIYNIPDVAEGDFIELRNKAANHSTAGVSNSRIARLLDSSFPVVRKGYYKIKVKYSLPGKSTALNAYDFQLYNPVGQE